MRPEFIPNETFEARLKIRALVRNAVLLRVVVAVALHFTVSEFLFAPDQWAYNHHGSMLARYWSGEIYVFPVFPREHPVGYFYIVAVVYSLFGESPLVLKLLNALLGGLTVALVYDLVMRIVGQAPVAIRAATLAAYFPSLVLWSALNIRDVWVIALVLIVTRQALVLQEGLKPLSFAIAALALWGLTQFRTYIFLPVAGPAIVSFLVTRRGGNMGRNLTFGMALAIVAVYIDYAAGTERRLRTVNLEEINYFRYWNTVGAASAIDAKADVSTPTGALMYLPLGLAYFLFAPFPWMLGSVRQILAVPETLFFYSLVPAMIRGVKWLFSRRLAESLMMLMLTAGLTFGYALGEGNAGTAYRHRAQLLSFYLIFAAVGIELKRSADLRVRPAAPRPGRPAARAQAAIT